MAQGGRWCLMVLPRKCPGAAQSRTFDHSCQAGSNIILPTHGEEAALWPPSRRQPGVHQSKKRGHRGWGSSAPWAEWETRQHPTPFLLTSGAGSSQAICGITDDGKIFRWKYIIKIHPWRWGFDKQIHLHLRQEQHGTDKTRPESSSSTYWLRQFTRALGDMRF